MRYAGPNPPHRAVQPLQTSQEFFATFSDFAWQSLDVDEKVTQADAKGPSYPLKASGSNLFVAVFQFRQVLAGQFRMIGKHRLSPPLLRSQDADAPSDLHADVGRSCHVFSMAVCCGLHVSPSFVSATLARLRNSHRGRGTPARRSLRAAMDSHSFGQGRRRLDPRGRWQE